MPIMTGLALGLGIASAAGAVGSAAIGSSAAGKAANAQENSANYAATLQKQSADEALAFQKEQYANQQAIAAPFVQAGQGAVTQLSQLLQPGGALSQQWNQQFQAPTSVTEQNDPGYQFALQQGQQALENSAAAKGGLLSGGTGKALEQYGQNYAAGQYQDVYNRALQQYQQSYNQFQNNQTTQYNRLAGLAGTGQTSAGQLMSAGSANANAISNILMGSAGQIGQDYQNAGAAAAGGAINTGNSLSSGLSGLTGGLGNSLLLSQLMGGGSSSYSNPINQINNVPLSYGAQG